MKIKYLTQPIPGTPFKLNVNWDYTRQTDKKKYHFHEEEDIQNKHILVSKHLRTNKKQYRPGEKVELYALVKSNRPVDCEDYYAVAYLIPLADERKKIPVILRPSSCTTEKVCIDFSNDKPNTTLPNPFKRLGVEFKALGKRRFRIIDAYQHDNKGELALIPKGMFVKIPPSTAVEAHIVTFGSPVGIEASSNGQKIDRIISPQDQQGVVHTLRIEGDGIDTVEFFGGSNEASILMFCYEPIAVVKDVKTLTHLITTSRNKNEKICCFKGSVTLDSKEKPGKWNAYLFVQTINIAPEGISPEKAAQIIGGISLSQNMEDVKNVEDTDIKCGACDIVDYVFEII